MPQPLSLAHILATGPNTVFGDEAATARGSRTLWAAAPAPVSAKKRAVSATATAGEGLRIGRRRKTTSHVSHV